MREGGDTAAVLAGKRREPQALTDAQPPSRGTRGGRWERSRDDHPRPQRPDAPGRWRTEVRTRRRGSVTRFRSQEGAAPDGAGGSPAVRARAPPAPSSLAMSVASVECKECQLAEIEELDESSMLGQPCRARSDSNGTLSVRGARVHNLHNVDLEIPRDSLVVFTGLSGSGKSSLAFDTIFAEGQRRYVESLSRVRPPVPRPGRSPRRRLHRGTEPRGLDRPEVDQPQPAVDRRHDHRDLRLHAPALGAHRRAALPRVRRADRASDGAADRRPAHDARERHPVPDGQPRRLAEEGRVRRPLRRARRERILARDRRRRADSAERTAHPQEAVQARHLGRRRPSRRRRRHPHQAHRLARDRAAAHRRHSCRSTSSTRPGDAAWRSFSEKLSCPNNHPLQLTEIEPRTFSFNAPFGACPECSGLGTRMSVDSDLLIPATASASPTASSCPGPVRARASSTTSKSCWRVSPAISTSR